MNIIFVMTALLGALQTCLGANILFLIPMPAKSHYNLGDRFIRELIQRGHQVTLISSFPMSKPPKGLTEIVVPDLEKIFNKSIIEKAGKSEGRFNLRSMTPLAFLFFTGLGGLVFNGVMEDKKVNDLLNSNKKFDLIIGECFLVEGLLAGFSHKFDAPIVAIATFIPNTWSNYLVGNPSPPSYIPEPILPFTNKMNFIQRCINVVYGVLSELMYQLKHLPSQEIIMKKHFGSNLPSIKEILSNTSAVLVNHHHSFTFPRAYLPNMIEVGSFHIKETQPLPKDIQTYMDEARDGVILFSMGSNLPSSDMPQEKIQGILRAFSKLKQRVLWKFEKEDIPNLPKNVKISKWLPQSDILAHPNMKLFITHGGMLSVTEAVYKGVPLVAIPIFGDQPANVNSVVEKEVGVKLLYDEINEYDLSRAINEVLSNPKYAKNMKYQSMLLRDVPVRQLDLAIFWTEYVIRHKGAPHLRSEAQNLSWYQLYLLDVFGALAFTIFFVLFIIWKLLKCIAGFCCGKKARPTHAKKKN